MLLGCTANSRESYVKMIVGSELTIPVDSMIKGNDSGLHAEEINKGTSNNFKIKAFASVESLDLE